MLRRRDATFLEQASTRLRRRGCQANGGLIPLRILYKRNTPTSHASDKAERQRVSHDRLLHHQSCLSVLVPRFVWVGWDRVHMYIDREVARVGRTAPPPHTVQETVRTTSANDPLWRMYCRRRKSQVLLCRVLNTIANAYRRLFSSGRHGWHSIWRLHFRDRSAHDFTVGQMCPTCTLRRLWGMYCTFRLLGRGSRASDASEHRVESGLIRLCRAG